MQPIPPGGGIPVATLLNPGLMAALGSAGGSPLTFYSAVIDFTVTGIYQVIAPIALRARIGTTEVTGIELKTTGATVSPTVQMGSDASFLNLWASQTITGLHTQAAETNVGGTFVSPLPILDLTANGLQFKVTSGATGGVLTGRVFAMAQFLPE